MKSYWINSEDAARFVGGLAEHSKLGSPLTTIITREKSEVYSVSIVTATLSGDIDERTRDFYKPHLPTQKVLIQEDLFHLRLNERNAMRVYERLNKMKMYDEIDMRNTASKWYWIGCAAGVVGTLGMCLLIGLYFNS